jgi:hypothetical protein
MRSPKAHRLRGRPPTIARDGRTLVLAFTATPAG